MLMGGLVAQTSHGAVGCTFESKSYQALIDNVKFKFFDTAGLGEADGGTVRNDEAFRNLIRLMKTFKREGLHAIVMVTDMGRIDKSTQRNYNVFIRLLCKEEVPAILCVTKCELADPINRWKIENDEKVNFKLGMPFKDIVCVTTIQSGNYAVIFRDAFEDSKRRLLQALQVCALKEQWTIPAISMMDTFIAVLKYVYNIAVDLYGGKKWDMSAALTEFLKRIGFSDSEATEKANVMYLELNVN